MPLLKVTVRCPATVQTRITRFIHWQHRHNRCPVIEFIKPTQVPEGMFITKGVRQTKKPTKVLIMRKSPDRSD